MKYSAFIKEKLVSLINEMDQYHWLFTRNAEKDFSRIKKWSFSEIMRFIISMEGKSLKDELLEHFNFSVDTPTNSSFNQRRAQILPEAFEFLFREFTAVASGEKLFRGYRLLACDGSDLCIAHNPQDETTYFQSTPDSKGFNQMHLNALYDLLSRTYVDAIIQPARQENENGAMCDMIDRYPGHSKTLFIADRGYENYNLMAHLINNDWKFLIRVKDKHSNGIASTLKLDLKDEFDKDVSITFTRKQTKAKRNSGYKFMPTNQRFDYLPLKSDDTYTINFRIARFPIGENSYEMVVTNLDRFNFPVASLKDIYHLRWGIETSFRELKYSIGLTSFHAKKVDYIKQEIFARLTLYNYCELITSHVVEQMEDKNNTKQVNFTIAIYICREFLRHKKQLSPPDVIKLIKKYILPVRLGRKDPRKVKPQSAVSFLYRVA